MTVVGLAQTLARPGLAGSGIDTLPWWHHAVFYQASPSSDDAPDLKALSLRLDSMRSVGIDALLLPAPVLPAPGSGAQMPNLDDLDALLQRASTRDIRVLLRIDAGSNNTNLEGLARFWLNRGVAGLYVRTSDGVSPEAAQAAVETVRRVASSVPGRRIVISDLANIPADSHSPAPAVHQSRMGKKSVDSGAQLLIDSSPAALSSLEASNLRPVLSRSDSYPDLLLEIKAKEGSSKVAAIAAVTMLMHPAALVDSSAGPPLRAVKEETDLPIDAAKPAIPPQLPPGEFGAYVPYVAPSKRRERRPSEPVATDPLTAWYRTLIGLRTGDSAIHTGKKIFLDLDAQNVLAWVYRPTAPSARKPAVVVLCNLSGAQVQFSIADGLKGLNLHGAYLRALARWGDGVGPQNINSIALPPFGVFIGELRR